MEAAHGGMDHDARLWLYAIIFFNENKGAI